MLSWLKRNWGQAVAFAAAGLTTGLALEGSESSGNATALALGFLATGVGLRGIAVFRAGLTPVRLRTRRMRSGAAAGRSAAAAGLSKAGRDPPT